MKIIPVSKFPSQVQRLAHKHGYNFDEYEYGWAQVGRKSLEAYCLCKEYPKYMEIDWIWARPGKGTKFLKLIERRLFKLKPEIRLLVSIDKGERDQTVIRRMNFYIKNQYRVQKIEYRKSGVMFYMLKKK